MGEPVDQSNPDKTEREQRRDERKEERKEDRQERKEERQQERQDQRPHPDNTLPEPQPPEPTQLPA